jgi:hypothetical protein
MFKKIVLSDIKVGGNTSAYSNVSRPLVPYTNVIPEGKYASEIKSIGVIGDEASGIAVVHTLTDSAGNTYHVRFCYYGAGVYRFIDALGRSGFVGNLCDVAGYKEVVAIVHGPKYAYIAERQKSGIPSNTATPFAADTAVDTAVHQPESEEDEAKVETPRKGGLLSYRRKLKTSKAEELLSTAEDTDDDEFDDFLENDE